jgi:hypothetical protein
VEGVREKLIFRQDSLSWRKRNEWDISLRDTEIGEL